MISRARESACYIYIYTRAHPKQRYGIVATVSHDFYRVNRTYHT